MKFDRLVDPLERLTHTKFQLIIVIIDEDTALTLKGVMSKMVIK